jgi:hypothetical protein
MGIHLYNLATHRWLEITGYQTYYPYLPITITRTEPWEWHGLIARDVLFPTQTTPSRGAAAGMYSFKLPIQQNS